MIADLSCYGASVRGLAEVVGDFDLRSPMDVLAWYRREWQSIADLLGFSQQYARAVPREGRSRIAAMNVAGLEAFAAMLHAERPGVTADQARVQTSVLARTSAPARERGELWRIVVDPTTLPTGACYDDGGRSLRAFHPDTAAGYFGDGWTGPPPRAESSCGWQTPLVLHIGTFPWVYSSRLDGPGPGARWFSKDFSPAILGLQLAVSLMDPASNLQQDARQVAAILDHFVSHTAALVSRLPIYQAGRAELGKLHRRGGMLYVHQGSLHVAGLDGPRGRIAAPAYNYILRRFACFFAVRRAALRALVTLPADVQRAALTSGDPCLRQHAEEAARAA
jgi:hypothetical protein